MRLHYTRKAALQLEAILSYVAGRSPRGAASLLTRIEQIETLLRQFPLSGRATTIRGVRRIAVVPYPYVLDYRVAGDEVIIPAHPPYVPQADGRVTRRPKNRVVIAVSPAQNAVAPTTLESHPTVPSTHE